MSDPIQIDDQRPEAELPEDIRPLVTRYRDTTAAPDIAGLRARLESAGFFTAGVPRRGFPLLRIAGLIAVAATLVFILGIGRSLHPVYASVIRVVGQASLVRNDGHHRLDGPFALRVGDEVRSGSVACILALDGGGEIRIDAQSRVSCVRDESGRIALDVSGGGVALRAKTKPIAFRACGQMFTCAGSSCTIKRCCSAPDHGGVVIETAGAGISRFEGSRRERPCSPGARLRAGKCSCCGMGR